MKKLFILTSLFLICLNSNAQNWYPVGKGMNVGTFSGTGFVYALDTLGGKLYAGGTMDSAGGIAVSNIAEWNGVIWSTLGKGLSSSFYGTGCFALTTYNGNIYAGGRFDTAGGVPANNISEWNGSKWIPLASGLNGTVYALEVYNGNLYAGGYFDTAGGIPVSNIARWNGTSWSAVGPGTDGYVFALTVYNNNLYAGGSFGLAGGITVNDIAEWNGTVWSSLGSGVIFDEGSSVDALTIFNGSLCVGGLFDTVGGKPVNNIATWNGATWSTLGKGLGGNCCTWPYVAAVNVFNGNLYVGGSFDSAGVITANNIAEWDGVKWDSLNRGMLGGAGTGGGFSGITYVNALLGYDGNFYAGGAFALAGKTIAYNIAEWCPSSCPAGINELSQNNNDIKVYPNPSNGIFTIEERGVRDKEQVVEVYNMLGEKILSQNLTIESENQIDLSAQPAGIYLYRVLTEQGALVTSGKLVITL